MARLRAHAFAKINLALRIHGVRGDGYHDLTTIFQTIALHDTLTLAPSRGPFELRCSDPTCPSDSTNLVWRAAASVWRAAGRRGAPAGVNVRLRKRIPQRAGLGGGSADAAAAIAALIRFWRLRIDAAQVKRIAASLGADVPFFLKGGRALGSGRGDRLRALPDAAERWVVLLLPGFGVSTSDAYGWWDRAHVAAATQDVASPLVVGNDLEAVVAARHPEIGRLVRGLVAAGASHAAMSGSGSAVFGFFSTRRAAAEAARTLRRQTTRALLTRTLSRSQFQARSRPTAV